MQHSPATDWRTVVLLYTSSTIAQLGQFGIVFLVLPIWLTQHGVDAERLGQFDASVWLGMLPGLALGPWLSRRFGPRAVVVAGLLVSVLGLMLVSADSRWEMLGAGCIAGCGMGLRWVSLEPWLYSLVPPASLGRLVGINETLIALTPILAPAAAAWVGLDTRQPIYLGIVFTLAAMPPLFLTRRPAAPVRAAAAPSAQTRSHSVQLLQLGLATALFGGAIEGVFCGLFPAFGAERQLDGAQVAQYLSVFGVGGLLMQYAAGWLTDHKGLGFTVTVCAVGTVLLGIFMSCPLQPWSMGLAMLLLGGFVCAFLTLSLIAAMTAVTGTMAGNVSRITMVYTSSAAAGPWVAGWVMSRYGNHTLVLQISVLALLLVALIRWVGRRAPLQPA